MRVIFVHGWSVTHANTYGQLPLALSSAAEAAGLELDLHHLFLGRYISFKDEVTMNDIARAMDRALRDLPGNNDGRITPFSCITHSTGGPVVRHWVNRFYGADSLDSLPLDHLVMLAPANHGSTLAKLGKARVGRIKAWFQGIEPGQRVLDWLSLGSDGQWDLNRDYLDYSFTNNGFFPFVLIGQGIDHQFYDFLNSYLVEKGSDGVVRVAGANMNYRFFSLIQALDQVIRKRPLTYALAPGEEVGFSDGAALGVYDEYSHSGTKMGIMRSIKEADTQAPIVQDILKCFQVTDPAGYETRKKELEALTAREQKDSKMDRYSMLVFNILDDQGRRIAKDDYDLILLAGKTYLPQHLPRGFFVDRQMNNRTGRLVYYLDADKMGEIKDGKFGFRLIVRPSSGFSYYCAGEFQSGHIQLDAILSPNETTYMDIKIHRFVDKNVFRFDPATEKPVNFKGIKPSGANVDNE